MIFGPFKFSIGRQEDGRRLFRALQNSRYASWGRNIPSMVFWAASYQSFLKEGVLVQLSI
jgi:hypothetical protein